MKLTIKHQERYSRGELLLRTLFGWLYIYLPHGFLLMFVSLWGAILQFVAFWVILFTGRYPESMFEFQVGLLKWNVRVTARMYNVSDGYPAFGIKSTDDHTDITVPYPEKVSRGLTLVRLLFGIFYVYLPHGFILMFRAFFVGILQFLAWWVVLFTAEYPKNMHDWIVGQVRWQMRVNLYMMFMTDTYPPFTGDELPDEA
ncbi:MAG: DUF4389 domain-containing protein [Bacteroidales bacterium]|nr:DUF4389 domain-containing protein [Bacteroidales bacterium]